MSADELKRRREAHREKQYRQQQLINAVVGAITGIGIVLYICFWLALGGGVLYVLYAFAQLLLHYAR